jgi:hypothetical protein
MTKAVPLQDRVDSLWGLIKSLGDTIADPATGNTFWQALRKSWLLLVQLVLIAGVLLLVVITAAVLLWSVSFQSGRYYRLEAERLGSPEAFAAKIFEDFAKWLKQTSEFLINNLLGIATPPTKPSDQTTTGKQKLVPITKDPKSAA